MQPSDMQQLYRNVFGTVEGRKVLGDILTLGHFGVVLLPEPTAPVELVEFNFAMTIARTAGALDLVYPQLGIPTKES